jgi:Cu-Zn family superoxide dismutase
MVAVTQQIAQAQVPPIGASAQLHDASGKVVAEATFRQASDEVLINLTFPDRTVMTGTHGIQIHQVGRCDPPDFSSAGAILNPGNKQHGLLNSNGPMAGDLPSLVIGPAGVAVYNISAPAVTLGPGPTSLLGPQGSALVIYSQADDDSSQPEGNAGVRIACGVIMAGGLPQPAAGPLAIPLAQAHLDTTDSILIALVGGLLITGGVLLRRR